MDAKKRLCLFIGAALVCCGYAWGDAHSVLVEAESFDQLGGWVNDSQFMDRMGSPFLLAHGLGRPVEDAGTTVELPAPGTYRVWVRTRDWAAPWTKGKVEAPGKFNVVINGTPLGTVFGTEGAEWHWQDGGTVRIANRRIDLRLRDLTGFAGRCDAILFSSDLTAVPPDDAPAAWRRALLNLPEEPRFEGEYDLVVVGGGVAGMTTAISAGRLGLSVALVHNRPVLGGNSSSEAGVGHAGRYCIEPYPNVGLVTREISWGYHDNPNWTFHDPADAHVYQLKALKEAGVDLFSNYHANEVFMDSEGGVAGVVAQHIFSSERIRVNGRWFADCTGDGAIGYLAGADFDMSAVRMGRSNLWNVHDTGSPVEFPRCPWAWDLSEKPFPGRRGEYASPNHRFDSLFGWFWESGFEHDPFEKGEMIRDNNFRAMYGAWDVLKNVDKVYETFEIARSRYISGLRETRRLLGPVVLNTQDLRSGRVYEDGVVALTWDIDVHIANPLFTDKVGHHEGFTQWPFIADAPMGENTHYPRPYWMPYRCLYSRNIPNLFMAGRNVSVTREALGAARVMPTTGMMGEIVGMAAFLCKQHDVNPDAVYENHLEELKQLMDEGVGRKLDVQVLAEEPFEISADRLNGVGSGSGWKGDWTATTGSGPQLANGSLVYPAGAEPEARGDRLFELSGRVAAMRLLEKPFSLASGGVFVSFLARRDETGHFRVEFSNADQHIRLGVEVRLDGTVIPRGATVTTPSEPGLFQPDKTYLVVLRFTNVGGRSGAVSRVKLFDADKETVPATPRVIEWDVETTGSNTGAGQDRILISISAGSVELDELRIGESWDSVLGSN